MNARRALTLLSLLGPALFGCGSPIVGAECAPGFERCGERCIDTRSDPDHCGRCGRTCSALECRGGECGPGPRDVDAGPGDSGVALHDGGARDAPFLPDGGFAFPVQAVGRGCHVGQIRCGSTCVDLRNDAEHCGACDAACTADRYCVRGECITCDPPLQRCGPACINFDDDPNFCGGCTHVCRSGICSDATCGDVLTGHVVVIGHDYRVEASPTAKRLAGNALFLALGSPVRALVYEGSAAPASVNGVTAAIHYVVEQDGRDWAPLSTSAAAIPADLRSADALLIHAQAGSSDAELTELGQEIGLAITQFLLRGGVIVVIEAPSSANAGTFQVLAPSGLFDAGAREAVSSQTLRVVDPGVGVAARVTRNYRSSDDTVRFVDVSVPGEAIVTDGNGNPVVFHRSVAP